MADEGCDGDGECEAGVLPDQNRAEENGQQAQYEIVNGQLSDNVVGHFLSKKRNAYTDKDCHRSNNEGENSSGFNSFHLQLLRGIRKGVISL